MTFTLDTTLSFGIILMIVYQIWNGGRRASKEEGKREEWSEEVKKKIEGMTTAHADCKESLPDKFFAKDAGVKLENCISETKKTISVHGERLAKIEARP